MIQLIIDLLTPIFEKMGVSPGRRADLCHVVERVYLYNSNHVCDC